MTRKLKVMTVVGTRPEIIRLSRVMAALDRSDAIEHITVHTGQNYDYELNGIFYEDMGIRKPDHYLDAAGISATATVGKILISIEPILKEVRPDAFLVLGDTNSSLCAIAAKKKHIPVFHMEAGNRCFDQRVPEETNRRIVDHIADINLTYSSIASEYLLREGLPPDRVIKTGSPMFEVLNYHKAKIDHSKVLDELGLEKEKYFVVSAHREENIDSEESFNSLVQALNELAAEYNLPIIFSTHPRTRKMIESRKAKVSDQIRLLKPMSFSDYNALQKHSLVVLSDSGTISEESSILNFRALNIRETHERPEAMEETPLVMTGLRGERVMQGIHQVISQRIGETRDFALVGDYGRPNVSDKVVRIIMSYVDYVNRVVWGQFNETVR